MDLMRVEDVAQETGISVNTLRYWVTQGTGPKSAKVGRRRMYRRADVQAWLDEQFKVAS